MAFQLKRNKPIADELRRITRRELRDALVELNVRPPPEEAIHEARKCVKRARAILRLLRPTLKGEYAVEMEELRIAAHALASLRDADVTVDTIKALHGRYPTVVTTAVLREVTRGLQNRRQRARAHAAPVLGKAIRALERAGRKAPRGVRRVASFGAVRKGTVDAYRRARTALKDLSVDTEAVRFHLLRKRVKDLWYDASLFEALHPSAKKRARTLERLETLLGEDHDLAILRDLMQSAPNRYGGASSTALVLGAIARRQLLLRTRALTLGHRSFAERPRDFEATVVKWWRAQ